MKIPKEELGATGSYLKKSKTTKTLLVRILRGVYPGVQNKCIL